MTGKGETIQLNGRPRALEWSVVADLVRALHGPGAAGIAVAVNGQVVRRSEWSRKTLRPGDAVEVVGAVQGG